MWFARCLTIALISTAIGLAGCSSDGKDGDDAGARTDGGAGGDVAPACVPQGGACSNGQRCCAGLACCAGVPVPSGQEFCGSTCPIAATTPARHSCPGQDAVAAVPSPARAGGGAWRRPL